MSTEVKRKRSNNAVFTGLIIVALGVIWLLRKMDVMIPGWLVSWQMILIIIGIGIGVGNKFRKPASWILIGIGTIFLINDIYYIPFEIREYFWPVLVIAIGLVILLKPKRHKALKSGQDIPEGEGYDDAETAGTFSRGDLLDSVSIFNGIKRNVLSKNFRGGETVSVFGGTEVNLLQADFNKMVHLESTVIFGGLKLIVPKNWEVRTEVTSILGGVEDKRYSAVEVLPDEKILVLTGTVIFGGIDIVSY